MKNKILFLNVKHTSLRPEYFLSALRSKGWEISTLDVEFKFMYKYFALLTTFHPNISKWKSRLDKKMNIYNKLPSTFIKKSKYLENKLKKHTGKYDLTFQFFGMYSHNTRIPKTPYAVFTDWTRSLTIKEYPAWAPIEAEKNVKDWLKLEGDLYRNAAKVFSMSNRTRDSVINNYAVPENKVVTVGYSSMLEKVPKKNLNKDYSLKTILFVGYQFERKGGFVLLEAFKKVRESVKGARLVIITKGQLREQIERDGVRFIDSKVPRGEVLKQFEKASLFAMPSFCEPFAAAFLEAMAYQLPCIGTSNGGMPEQIEDGKTGFIIPPQDSEALSEKIILLLKENTLMKKMGEAGYARLKNRFTWSIVAGNIDNHLRKILN